MTELDRKALATVPLTAHEVQVIYQVASGPLPNHPSIAHVIRRLCTSHERLRRELQGAEDLLTDMEARKCPPN